MKGIILAGGSGSRLNPTTLGISKQLIPIYDKPMIYYPLSVLMLAGIREILIITTPHDQSNFYRLLGDGEKFGVSLSYAIQPLPQGLAQALIIAEEFIGDQVSCLALGDNIYYGQGLSEKLKAAKINTYSNKATIFTHTVRNPTSYGVVEFNADNEIVSIVEKPKIPPSNCAVTGLYFFDNRAAEFAKKVPFSERGELEIVSVLEKYLETNDLSAESLGRGFAWLDTGTHESLHEASQFVHTLEKRQGAKIACLEEIAYKNNWITMNELEIVANKLKNSSYGAYLFEILEQAR